MSLPYVLSVSSSAVEPASDVRTGRAAEGAEGPEFVDDGAGVVPVAVGTEPAVVTGAAVGTDVLGVRSVSEASGVASVVVFRWFVTVRAVFDDVVADGVGVPDVVGVPFEVAGVAGVSLDSVEVTGAECEVVVVVVLVVESALPVSPVSPVPGSSEESDSEDSVYVVLVTGVVLVVTGVVLAVTGVVLAVAGASVVVVVSVVSVDAGSDVLVRDSVFTDPPLAVDVSVTGRIVERSDRPLSSTGTSSPVPVRVPEPVPVAVRVPVLVPVPVPAVLPLPLSSATGSVVTPSMPLDTVVRFFSQSVLLVTRCSAPASNRSLTPEPRNVCQLGVQLP